MLDAASCGLPIIVNDTLSEIERVSGNGIQYRLNDLDSLRAAILLLKDAAVRKKFGLCGAEKMSRDFGWESIARRRVKHYEEALAGGRL